MAAKRPGVQNGVALDARLRAGTCVCLPSVMTMSNRITASRRRRGRTDGTTF